MRKLSVRILLIVTAAVLAAAGVFASLNFSAKPSFAANAFVNGQIWATGVDANGNTIADGADDPHWTLVDVLPMPGVDYGPNYPGPTYPAHMCQSGTFPRPATKISNSVNAGTWVDPTQINWIGQNASGIMDGTPGCTILSNSTNEGLYIFRMNGTFDFASWVDPNYVTLTIPYTVDNFIYKILVNGQQAQLTNAGCSFNVICTMAIPAQAGLFQQTGNTLEIQVRSTYSATGLALQTSYSADPASLHIVKAVSTSSPAISQPFNYTMTVTNTAVAGAMPASNWTVSDTINANLTVNSATVDGGSCSISGQVVTCNSTTVLQPQAANYATVTISATAKGSAIGQTIPNTGYVYGNGDPNCLTATSCPSNVVNITPIGPDLRNPVKAVSDANPRIGSNISYSVTVKNSGAAATVGTWTVSDTIPTGLTPSGTAVLNVGGTNTNCTTAGQIITCATATVLAANASATVTIPVTVGSTAALVNQTLPNTAYVYGGGDPTCVAATSCASNTVNVTPRAPLLSQTKAASTATPRVGTPFTYTITVSNGAAPAIATAGEYTITDKLPVNIKFNSGTIPGGTCTAAGDVATGQTVTCKSSQVINPGANIQITFNVTAQIDAANKTLANTAYTTGGGDPRCPASSQACASNVTTVTPKAPELKITKSNSNTDEDANGDFVVGKYSNYVLTVTNQGTADTTGEITISDSIPREFNLSTITTLIAVGSNGPTASDKTKCEVKNVRDITCTSSEILLANSANSLQIKVRVMPTVRIDNITNVADVYGALYDSDLYCIDEKTANDEANARCHSPLVRNLRAPKLDMAKTIVLPDSAKEDNLAGNGDSSSNGSSGNGSTKSPSSASPAVIPTATATATNTPGASGTSNPNNPSSSPSSSANSTAGGGSESNDSNSGSGGDSANSIPNVRLGTIFKYELTVTNTGTWYTNSTANFQDTLPAGVKLISLGEMKFANADGETLTATNGYSPDGAKCEIDKNNSQKFTCILPQGFPEGATVSLEVTAQLIQPTGQVMNVANVFGGGDPDCPNAEASFHANHCQADASLNAISPKLSVKKTVAQTNFQLNDSFTYLIEVQNQGNASTNLSTKMTDEVPANLEILGVTPDSQCKISGQNVTCEIGKNFQPGDAKLFAINVKAKTSSPEVKNVANVLGGGDVICVDKNAPAPFNKTVQTTDKRFNDASRCSSAVKIRIAEPPLPPKTAAWFAVRGVSVVGLLAIAAGMVFQVTKKRQLKVREKGR